MPFINPQTCKKIFQISCALTPIGSILRKISKLPSDGQKTKKLGINGHINISKGHQIPM